MLIIKSVALVDVKNKCIRVCDILIENGFIKEIGESLSDNGCDKIIDATGLKISAGFIDVHVHFREPGFTYKEDIATGARAAARGGFTTVVCMANTKPIVDNTDTLQKVLEASKKTDINVLTVAAVSESFACDKITDMAALKSAGAVGFSNDGVPILDENFLRNAANIAKSLDIPISLHEENPELIGCAGINEGEVSQKLGISGAPRISESSMVERDCKIALETGAQLHMQHLSCKESVDAIRIAKNQGANVTAEVTPQHFSLTEQAVLAHGTLAKLNPPFRTEADRLSLIEGLVDGTIDMIATDHAPHAAYEKEKPFAEAPSGIIGLETAFALGITNLVQQGHLTLFTLIEKMTVAPAKLYSLDSGVVEVGKRADLVIFDDNESFVVGDFASKSSNSPFVGEKLYGKVKYTICGGEIVFADI